MKVLVNEIEKEILFEIRKHFVEDNEITFLEYSENEKPTEFCKKPYYIEENIMNLQKVIDLCIAVDNGKSPLRKQLNWEQFACFSRHAVSCFFRPCIKKRKQPRSTPCISKQGHISAPEKPLLLFPTTRIQKRNETVKKP